LHVRSYYLLWAGYVAVCCSMLQRVAVCCSVLQCVAVCCSALRCVFQHISCELSATLLLQSSPIWKLWPAATHHTHCNPTHCNPTHDNARQHNCKSPLAFCPTVRYNSFMCDMTHSCAMCLINVRHDSFM